MIAWRSYRTLPRPDRYFSAVCFYLLTSFFFVMVSVASYGWGQDGYMLWILIALTVYVFRSKAAKAAGGISLSAGGTVPPTTKLQYLNDGKD